MYHLKTEKAYYPYLKEQHSFKNYLKTDNGNEAGHNKPRAPPKPEPESNLEKASQY